MSQSKFSMSPTKFRATLISLMILVLSLGVFGFYTAQTTLASYASDVRAKVSEAEASKDSIEQLKNLQAELERLKDTRERAGAIAADSQLYNYQNQIIDDINRYARQSGVTVSRFEFQTSSSPAQPATPSPSSMEDPTALENQPATTGLRSTTVNVSLETPVNYTNLLRFIRSIEQSLTKMQVDGISLSPGSDTDTVSTDTLNIEVYIK